MGPSKEGPEKSMADAELSPAVRYESRRSEAAEKIIATHKDWVVNPGLCPCRAHAVQLKISFTFENRLREVGLFSTVIVSASCRRSSR